MSLTAKLRRAPLRVATGAYILNSGLTKFKADADTSKALHGMAANTLPPVQKVEPKVFIKALAVGECALGAGLLLPIVPVGVAAIGLGAFSGTLLTMYWKTPGLHEEGSIRPTQQGVPIAKDVWMAGIAGGLLVDALTAPAHDKKVEVTATVSEKARGRAARKAKRSAKKEQKAALAQAKEMAKHSKELAKQGRAAAKVAAAQAKDAAAHAKGQAKDLSAQARSQAKDYAKDLQPKVKDLSEQARDAVVQAKDDASRKAKKAAAKAGVKAAV